MIVNNFILFSISSAIYFRPPNPIKRAYTSKEDYEIEKARKSKNVSYLNYMKKMNFLLHDMNKNDEYNPVIPNDYEMVIKFRKILTVIFNKYRF